MSLVVPAVLPTSREDFEEKIGHLVILPDIDRIQIDVVDGRFASPTSWPYTAPSEFSEMVAKGSMLPSLDRIEYEVDLMCLDAERAAGAWLELGASRLTFHAESLVDLGRSLEAARIHYGCGLVSCGLVSFGLALNIESDLALIESFVDEVQYIQFMGIARIGRQGQPFDRRVLNKIHLFHTRHPKIEIQVDGGVSLDTAPALIKEGATRLVVGSAILHALHPSAEIAKFEAL